MIKTGAIDGAAFAIAAPAKWNRGIVLLVHSHMAGEDPLRANPPSRRRAYRTLVDEGWIVARTNFRNDRRDVAESLADIDALRSYIVTLYGEPRRVIVEGEGYGSLVATRLAERDPADSPRYPAEIPRYDGVIAIDPMLQARDTLVTLGFTRNPRVPLIFLCNQSELEAVSEYSAQDLRLLPPAVLVVARNGHLNINQEERLAALRALNLWLSRGRAAMPQPKGDQPHADVTFVPSPLPSQVTMHPDRRGFDAEVTEVIAPFGHLMFSAQPEDLEAIGVKPLTWFQVRFGERNYRVFYGRDVRSVDRRDWVLLIHAERFAMLVRSFASAAAATGVTTGGKITVRHFDSGAEATTPEP